MWHYAETGKGRPLVLLHGLGMSHAELVENLGTIAHSGSKAFLEQLKVNKGDTSLIGQFGVGFYSAFMVAEKVTVFTRSYRPEEKGWLWTSDGQTGYEIEPAGELDRGTKVVLNLREPEFARASRIEQISVAELHRRLPPGG